MPESKRWAKPVPYDGDGRPATAQEVADYLSVSVQTLYIWRLKDYGPTARRVGGRLRYDWDTVKAWYAEQPESKAGAA